MPYYETVFMARQDLSESQVKELTEKLSKVVTSQGGKILKTENWGLRNLAYRINKSRKAHYVLLESDASGAAMIELERIMGIEEDVMRAQTIKLEAPSQGQSVILDKGGRDYDEDDKDEKEVA